MTKKTGTLWEHNGACASCDHGFASYVAKFLIYALTGYDVGNEVGADNAGKIEQSQVNGIACEITFPSDKKLSV